MDKQQDFAQKSVPGFLLTMRTEEDYDNDHSDDDSDHEGNDNRRIDDNSGVDYDDHDDIFGPRCSHVIHPDCW